MNNEIANSSGSYLNLELRLEEISRIPMWIDALAAQHAIPDHTCFAMDLCLEEVISNIVRHSEFREPGNVVQIKFLPDRGGLYAIVVEDTAAPFNPLLVPDTFAPRSFDQMSRGGQGIHLLRQFADAIEYESLGTGNRLIISFMPVKISPQSASRI